MQSVFLQITMQVKSLYFLWYTSDILRALQNALLSHV